MLSRREQAYEMYAAVRNIGGRVFGADPGEVKAARLATCDRALRTIRRAVGTGKVLPSEPDDDRLRTMLAYVEHRRRRIEAQPVPQRKTAPPAPDRRYVSPAQWSYPAADQPIGWE